MLGTSSSLLPTTVGITPSSHWGRSILRHLIPHLVGTEEEDRFREDIVSASEFHSRPRVLGEGMSGCQ